MNFIVISAKSLSSHFFSLPSRPMVANQPLPGFEQFTKNNWDGDRSRAVPKPVLARARSFLSSLALPKTHAAPGVDGSIALLWRTSSVYLFIEFKADGRTHWYFELAGKKPREKVMPRAADNNDIQGAISKALGALVRPQAIGVTIEQHSSANSFIAQVAPVQPLAFSPPV